MIEFNRFVLDNGLRVIVHEDFSTPIAAINILYNVGARDEDPEHTGFAHLFEHLMFGGSVNIPKYDTPLENAGGDNNAFTNNDITDYYLTLPAKNIEIAFWLESDRMLRLAFNEKSLEVQRNVVIEEFRQVYLNQPYGDSWLLLRPLAYKKHPYLWPTIGKDITHIEKATMEEVVAFYEKYYNPNNAILAVAGNIRTEEIKNLTKKWFSPIKAGAEVHRNLPREPEQTESRTLTVERNVPFDAVYKAYHMCKRTDGNYYAADLLSDILSNGDSSRLYQKLVKEQQVFSEVNAFITGDLDEGLFILTGKPAVGVGLPEAENALLEQVDNICSRLPEELEMEKVKNKIESSFEFSQMNVLHKAINLSFYEHIGDADLIHTEIDKYQAVTPEEVTGAASSVLRKNNCSTLYYTSNH